MVLRHRPGKTELETPAPPHLLLKIATARLAKNGLAGNKENPDLKRIIAYVSDLDFFSSDDTDRRFGTACQPLVAFRTVIWSFNVQKS